MPSAAVGPKGHPNMTMPGVALLFLCVLALACSSAPTGSFQDQIRPDDTTCLEEIEQAKRDIAEQQFYYCDYFGLGVGPFRAEKELRAELDRLGIGYRAEGIECVVREGYGDNCYCRFMHEQIAKKYGEGFLDSLRFVADSL